MPARMWRHRIHPFLEILRHRLPYSLDYMVTFIAMAYSIITVLYETVPAFEDTCLECLGDLCYYWMAIEVDIKDCEVWTNVARSWYSKAADKKPQVGRLYHHIAILARPNLLQQLFFYAKSLTVTVPFSLARESILSLFEPVLSNKSTAVRPMDVCLVTLHGIWFTRINLDRFDGVLDEYLGLLDKHISKVGEKWTVQGCLIAVSNIAALYQYSNVMGGATVKEAVKEEDPGETTTELTAAAIKHGASDESSWVYAIKMGFQILNLVLHRIDDSHILPHIHAWMAFLFHIKESIPAICLLEIDFPWESLTSLLNLLIKEEPLDFEQDDFPVRQGRPLPEDWTLRGLEWTREYFPVGFIENAIVDDEERLLELPSFLSLRKQRILWLAHMIAKVGRRASDGRTGLLTNR